jgi:hypothetical protein
MAINQPLVIRQGEDFAFSFQARRNGVVVDITGYKVESYIRKRANSVDLVEEFDCSVLDGTAGTFLLSMPATRTAELPCGRSKEHYKSRYEYDVRLTSPEGAVIVPIEGRINVDPSVTRD